MRARCRVRVERLGVDEWRETEVEDPLCPAVVFPVVLPGDGRYGRVKVRLRRVEHSDPRCGPGCHPVAVYA